MGAGRLGLVSYPYHEKLKQWSFETSQRQGGGVLNTEARVKEVHEALPAFSESESVTYRFQGPL